MIPKALLKTFSYGAMHMTIAITVAYILSRNWTVALAIGFVEPCVQTIAYFFHERIWHKIEKKAHIIDAHNSVIDSTSPASHMIEDSLRDKPWREG